jgi:hypothetical protein
MELGHAGQTPFRGRVREFIAANLPEGSRTRARGGSRPDREWSRRLGGAGYAGPDVAEGTAARRAHSHQAIFLEEPRAPGRRRTWA